VVITAVAPESSKFQVEAKLKSWLVAPLRTMTLDPFLTVTVSYAGPWTLPEKVRTKPSKSSVLVPSM